MIEWGWYTRYEEFIINYSMDESFIFRKIYNIFFNINIEMLDLRWEIDI
jgi:hypothetical protein